MSAPPPTIAQIDQWTTQLKLSINKEIDTYAALIKAQLGAMQNQHRVVQETSSSEDLNKMAGSKDATDDSPLNLTFHGADKEYWQKTSVKFEKFLEKQGFKERPVVTTISSSSSGTLMPPRSSSSLQSTANIINNKAKVEDSPEDGELLSEVESTTRNNNHNAFNGPKISLQSQSKPTAVVAESHAIRQLMLQDTNQSDDDGESKASLATSNNTRSPPTRMSSKRKYPYYSEESSHSDHQSLTSEDSATLELPRKKFIIKYLYCQKSSCSKRFDSNRLLEKHMRSDHSKGYFKCTVYRCGERFISRFSLIQHYQTKHYNPPLQRGEWRCDKCSGHPKVHNQYPTQHDFMTHQPGTYICAFEHSEGGCSFEAATAGAVYTHFMRYHEGEELLETDKYKVSAIMCPECEEWFMEAKILDAHRRDKHGIEVFDCPVDRCGSSFRWRKDLLKHGSKKHPTEDWKCPRCLERFNNIGSLSYHMYLAYVEGCFECTACSFQGKFRAEIVEHWNRKHGKKMVKN